MAAGKRLAFGCVVALLYSERWPTLGRDRFSERSGWQRGTHPERIALPRTSQLFEHAAQAHVLTAALDVEPAQLERCAQLRHAEGRHRAATYQRR